MPSILLGTNVLVYFYDTKSPKKQRRAELVLNHLNQLRAGCLSVQNLAELVSIVMRKLVPPLTPSQAYEQVSKLIGAWSVFNLTPQIILEATRGVRDHQLSFYDAQIWATARLNQIPIVFSEDFQDGQTLEGVRFVNPFKDEFVIEEW